MVAKLSWFLELKALFCTDEVDKIDVELLGAPHLSEEFRLPSDDLLYLKRKILILTSLAGASLRIPETSDVV